MRKSNKAPKFKSFRFFLLLQFTGLCLLAGHIHFRESKDQKFLESASKFQSDYLASIRNSIDLGKSLNSYSDIIYEEVRNPRGRDVQIFANKARESSELVFGSAILSSSKRKDLSSGFDQVMEKGEAVLTRLKDSDPDVARAVFEKDFRDKLKAFHLSLDSHKKYAQTQASRFFSTKFLSARNELGSDSFIGYGLVGLGAFALLGLFICFQGQFRFFTKKIDRKEKERSEFADKLYEKTQLIEEMRALCERALCPPPKAKSKMAFKEVSSFDFKKVESRLESFSKSSIKQFGEISNKQERNDQLFSAISGKVKEALSCLEMLNNFKRNIINMQISGKGDFAGSEEFLAGLTDLEGSLLELAKSKEALIHVPVSEWLESFNEGVASVSLALRQETLEIVSKSNYLQAKFNEDLEELRNSLFEFEKWSKDRNEALAQALVMSDPEEVQEFDSAKAA